MLNKVIKFVCLAGVATATQLDADADAELSPRHFEHGPLANIHNLIKTGGRSQRNVNNAVLNEMEDMEFRINRIEGKIGL